MTQVVVDREMRAKLLDLNQPLELCDDAGRVLARVVPAVEAAAGRIGPRISEEEIQRRSQSKEHARPTAEVLTYLESL